MSAPHEVPPSDAVGEGASHPRRELLLAVGLCTVGAVLVLVGVGRAWVVVEQADRLTIAAVGRTVSGSTIAPGLRALGLVAVAGVVAVAATRRTGRAVVGALLLLAGLATAALAVSYLGHGRLFDEASRSAHLCAVQTSYCKHPAGVRLDTLVARALPVWLVLTGGVAVAAGGALTAVRGRGWGGLGSSYEAPGAPAPEPVTDKGVWDALDRGDDPTT